ncbi:25973_t:CDS:1, partial [Racocetra persica]
NNLWIITNITTIDKNSVIDIKSSTPENYYPQDLQDISKIVFEKMIEKGNKKYTQYTKRFEKALELYKREMYNDNFIKNFDILVGSFVKAVGEYEKALQICKQQDTQRSNNKKLAFWLH